jgi:hypothetical protein
MVFDGQRNVCVIFGGYNAVGGAPTNAGDTWEWDASSWVHKANSGPSPRAYHAMAFDSNRGKTVLFGGDYPPLGDTWEWDGTSWTQRIGSGPPERYWHGMSYDSGRGSTVLFGGYNPTSTWLADTWEWNGTSWTQRASHPQGGRAAHAMAYDSVRGVTVLFGGAGSNSIPLGDTWEWNGTAWSLRTTSGPSPRLHHSMAYDAARGVTVLFGGSNDVPGNTQVGDTWEWDGNQWQTRWADGPSPRLSAGMAFDSQRNATVLFGGAGAGAYADTWHYRILPPGVPTLGGVGVAVLAVALLVVAGFLIRRTRMQPSAPSNPHANG